MCQIAGSPLASQLQSAKLAVGHQRGDGVLPPRLPLELISFLTDIFKSIDLDKSGYVEADELKSYLEAYGSEVADEEIERIIEEFDYDGSGRLDLKEFLVYTGEKLK